MNDEVVFSDHIKAHLPFGTLLKRFRQDRKMPQNVLAQKIHHSPSYLSLLESNQRRPTEELFEAIIVALELDAAQTEILRRSAGFTIASINVFADRLVELFGKDFPIGELNRTMLEHAQSAQIDGWFAYLKAVHLIEHGDGVSYDYLQHARLLLAPLRSPLLPPLLVIRARLLLAQINLRLGEIEAVISDMHILYPQVETWAADDQADAQVKDLYGDALGMQGEIALRQGDYNQAQQCFEHCIRIYKKLSQQNDEEKELAAAGLSKAYTRLAVLALLRLQIKEALAHCARAEVYQTERNDSSRALRIQEIKAWAFTEMSSFSEAIRLREQCRDAWRERGNIARLARNALYMGDDIRRYLEEAMGKQGFEGLQTSTVRHQRLAQFFKDPNYMHLLDQAEHLYREARDTFDRIGEKLLLGRCHRGLAIILRYKAAIVEHQQQLHLYHESFTILNEALSGDERLQLQRRTPSISEAIGAVYWDQGKLNEAWAFYESAFQSLATLQQYSWDRALERQRERVDRSRQALFSLRSEDQHAHPPPTDMQAFQKQLWSKLCDELLGVVRFAILSGTLVRFGNNDRDIGWLDQQIQLEKLDSRRILAQNSFSYSLSKSLPYGYDIGAKSLFAHRNNKFAHMLRTHRDQPFFYRDLCSLPILENGLNYKDSRVQTSELMANAVHYATQYHDAYAVRASLFELPLALEIKSPYVLVEIPEGGQEIMCYMANDANLAYQIQALFERLFALTLTREDTLDKFAKLLGTPLSENREEVLT